MKSMTGFGMKSGRGGGSLFSVEMKSVNHRYLDINVKMPPAYLSLERDILEKVRRFFARGRIDIYVREESLAPVLPFEKKDAKELARLLRNLKKELGLSGDVTLNNLLAFKDLIFRRNSFPSSKRKKALGDTVTASLKELEGMRHREGVSIQKWLRKSTSYLKQLAVKIEKESAKTAAAYKKRFSKKLKDLLGEGGADRIKMKSDVSFFIDKIDITEELIRIKSHLGQFVQLLGKKETMGRKLDFLTQEMAREINTIGAKAQNSNVSKDVVLFKSELEKIKEQIQNIE